MGDVLLAMCVSDRAAKGGALRGEQVAYGDTLR